MNLHILYRFIILTLLQSGFVALFFAGPLAGQECNEVTLNEARKSYELGKFHEVTRLLDRCLEQGFSSKQKVEAYRLMAISLLAMDSLSSGENAAAQLLGINPAYEANLFDPPSFIALINNLKMAGIRQMVTSVSKKAENIDQTPATIMVITRSEIENRGYMDLVELLKDVPGFDLTLFYGSEYANVYQRGFRQNNTEKTLLLIDGIEENDLWTNWAYIDRQYPLSNIERVEIIYGPASTMYGPNAFAGVINVISRNSVSAIKQNRNTGIDANLSYGTYNTRCLDMSLSGIKRNVSFTLSGRLFFSDEADLSGQSFFDYDPSVYDKVDYNSLLGIKSNAAQYLAGKNLPLSHPYYSLSSGNSVLSLTPAGIEAARNLDKSAYNQIVNGNKVGFTNKSKEGLLNGKVSIGNFMFGFQTWKYSRGSATQYTDTYVPGSENGFVWVPQLTYFFTKYENQINEKLFFSSLTTYRIHTLTQDSKFVSVSNYARGNKKLADLVNGVEPAWITQYAFENSKQLRTEIKVIYAPSPRFDLVSGLELRNGSLQGGYLFSLTPTPQDSAVITPSPKGGNSFNTWDAGLYSQGTFYARKNLKLTLGLRYDYNRVRDKDGFGSVLSPRFALVYAPGKLTFKAIYARGIMNVSNWTKYSSTGDRIPNPSLKTENIQNFEISAGYRFNQDFHTEVNLYHEDIDNVVGTVPVKGSTGININDNIGRFKINGAQASAVYQVGSLSAWFNYTYCNPRQTYSETGAVNNRVGDISAHQFNIGVNKPFLKYFNANLRANFTGERKVGPGTTVPLNSGNFPAVVVFNGALTCLSGWKVPGLNLQLVCNNILNSTYYHPGTKAADGVVNPTEILQRGRYFVVRIGYSF